MYKTGDLGRYLGDGNIEFLGREDFQVKIHGYRIELGEIEAALMQHTAVRTAVVAAVGQSRTDKRLVAYVVTDKGQIRTLPERGSSTGQLESEDDFARPLEGSLLDPLDRFAFKMDHRGLRRFNGRAYVQLDKPNLDEATLEDHYIKRRSYRKFQKQEIGLQQFSALLGCLLQVEIGGSALPKYMYGSAGSTYSVQTYFYIKPGRIESLDGGAYYYDPANHRLVLLSGNAFVDRSVYEPTNRTVFDESAFSIFLIAQLKAVKPLYGDFSTHFVTLEAGLMSQLLEMTAPTANLGLCQIGNLDFERIKDLFALDDGHLLLHSLVGGRVGADQSGLRGYMEETSEYRWMVEQLQEGNGSPLKTTLSSTRPAVSEPQFNADIASVLRDFLREKLPEYMVPSSIMVLDSLPLTSNGKVDRKALPTPDLMGQTTQTGYVAPETEMEQTIAAILRETLDLEKVGIHYNFFDLGANSVQMIQVYLKIRKLLKQEFPLVSVFEHPTICSLADFLTSRESDQASLEQGLEHGAKRKEAARAKQQIKEARFGQAE